MYLKSFVLDVYSIDWFIHFNGMGYFMPKG